MCAARGAPLACPCGLEPSTRTQRLLSATDLGWRTPSAFDEVNGGRGERVGVF